MSGSSRYKERHKKLGLCQDCPEPAVITRYCVKHYWSHLVKSRDYNSKHREEHRLYHQQRRKRFEEENKCNRCGIPLIEGEGKRCVNCATIIVRHAV